MAEIRHYETLIAYCPHFHIPHGPHSFSDHLVQTLDHRDIDEGLFIDYRGKPNITFRIEIKIYEMAKV